MGPDNRRLRTGEMLALASAVLLFLDLFLTWFSTAPARVGPFAVSPDLSAWEAFDVLDVVLGLIIVATVAFVVLAATQDAPALPVAGSVIVTVLGAIATLLVLYRILNQPGPNDLIDVEYGAYVGLLLCLGIAAGGFLAMRDEGTGFAGAPGRGRADALPGGGRGESPEPARGPARRPGAPSRLDSRRVIERDQVLHVARLARLELSEEEVDALAGELSTILDHIETIERLDLDGVEGTSHVVDVTNALREDEPRPSLPREVALAEAPDVAEGGFRVPSPGG